MRNAAALVIAATLASLTTDAVATQLDQQSLVTTGISGFAGKPSEARVVDIKEAAVTRVLWREHWDKPCQVTITGKDPDDARPTVDIGAYICLGGGAPLSAREVSFEGNPRYFVRGISVCTNNRDNHHLKGMEIVATRPQPDSTTVETVTVTDKASHPNCATWHPAVFCAANMVANGISLEVEDKAIVGMRLRCVARMN
jgi:hypothetical protein